MRSQHLKNFKSVLCVSEILPSEIGSKSISDSMFEQPIAFIYFFKLNFWFSQDGAADLTPWQLACTEVIVESINISLQK